MKKLAITSIIGLALAIALGFGFIPAAEQTASCAECESDNQSGIKKAFEEFDVQCRVQINVSNDDERCLVPSVYNKIVPILKGLAADNRFGPGDRILLIGVPQTGNLLAGANRGFQSLAPLDKDSLTIELNKTDGGNGALVKICTVDKNGNQKRVGTINFAEDNSTGKKTATVTGVKGKIVRVDVASFGSVVKKFKYVLTSRQ